MIYQFPSVFDASTQTEVRWYEHRVGSAGAGSNSGNVPPSYVHPTASQPQTSAAESIHYHHNEHLRQGDIAATIQSVSAPDVLGRPRLPAFSATPDFDRLENRKPLANATVVSAVVESEPDQHQTSVKSSPNQSQNSRTESEHGIPSSSNHNYDCDEGKKSESDTEVVSPAISNRGNNKQSQNKQPSNKTGKNHAVRQQSEYDNQPISDLEVNVDSESDTHKGDEHQLLQGNRDDNAQQVDDTADDETDSDSSATEEQALFHKLKSSRQGSVQSDLNVGGFGGIFGNTNSPHSYYSNQPPNYQYNDGEEVIAPAYPDAANNYPSQFTFNPYAVDDDITGNNYFGNFGKPSKIPAVPSRTSQSKLTGNDLILKNPLLYDPDPDATPV